MTGPTPHDTAAGRPPGAPGPRDGEGAGAAASPSAPAEPAPAEPGQAEPGQAEPAPVPGGPDEVPDPLAVATAERDEYLDALRRLQAEFDNYRKRVARQQAEAGDRAAGVLVEKLLPVLDTLDLAAAHLGEAPGPDGTALLQASAQLNDVLAKEGLERIEPAGLPFDPTAHEAVGHEPAPEPAPGGAGDAGDAGDDAADEADDADAGAEAGGDATADMGGAEEAGNGGAVVVQVMRAGYRWRGAVLRPAMVTVRG